MDKIKKITKSILVYYKAIFLNYPYWRVIYPDGKRTYRLYWCEANSLKQVFGGKLIIDS